MIQKDLKQPSILQSILPIFVLLTLIILNLVSGNDDTMSGANQLSLLLAAFTAGCIALFNGKKWKEIVDGIVSTFSNAVPAILILLMVGILSGAWMSAGIIPSMIYYGLDILRPEYFLPATVIITAVISVATGSSWSTIATIGVALIGIGDALGIDNAWTAGAIISGAYFGDKISPLSDTTNLAATVAEIDIFQHIRFMMHTTVPSIIITIIAFTVMGLMADSSGHSSSVEEFQTIIYSTYNISAWLLLIPVFVVFLIVKKYPAVPVLMIGSLLGAVAIGLFQHDYLLAMNNYQELTFNDYYRLLTQSMFGAMEPSTGLESADSLLSTGGMMGMMNTVWLIIAAMIFGGIMEAGHFLERITAALLKRIKNRPSMVTTTISGCVLFNTTTGDQYISIIIPGRMFLSAYKKNGYDNALLSRTLEDSATVTSVLIPWNTCGATQATILGVATIAYLPFAIFCWLTPLVSLTLAWLNIKQERKEFTKTKEIEL